MLSPSKLHPKRVGAVGFYISTGKILQQWLTLRPFLSRVMDEEHAEDGRFATAAHRFCSLDANNHCQIRRNYLAMFVRLKNQPRCLFHDAGFTMLTAR